MDDVLKFDTIRQYNAFNKHETRHPLVSIIDLSKAEPRQHRRMNYGFYTVFFKQIRCGDLRYGCNYYDYEEGTLIFLAPGQVIGENKEEEYYQPQGYALVFHPDLLLGTSLGHNFHEYSFFSYAVNEALHLSSYERQFVRECFSKIEFELNQPVDKHSARLIVDNIELFLNYCIRFYDRQFITRNHANKGVLERFENLLDDYFQSNKAQTLGLPTVGYCAQRLVLSANYFGDLIKKETGKSAQEYIQLKLISIAKERIFDPTKSLSEIAFELGFKYPQHFSRLFKQHVGYTPKDYRNSFN